MKVKQCKCLGVMYPYERFCLYCGAFILYNDVIEYHEIDKTLFNLADKNCI